MQQLRQLGYRDRPRALREIGELSRLLPKESASRIDLLVSKSAEPEMVLHYLARFKERQPLSYIKLLNSVVGSRCLVAVLGHSHFLAEEILQRPEWLENLLAPGDLERLLTAEHLRESLNAALSPGVPAPVELARFRRKQTLRILLRDVLNIATLPEITSELTALADAIVGVTYQRIEDHLSISHGTPRGNQGYQAHFAVIALGKMGGHELNFSSDIDLMYLYSAHGSTAGKASISNQEFFTRAARQLTDLLSAPSPEGICYRVDLRLRPDGSMGELCMSLDGACSYYAGRARDWELQMMIKGRVAAGDKATGQALLDFVEPLTYKTTLDFSAIEALSLTRERINEKLAGRSRKTYAALDVKLAPGGIRDIEFLVQCLQRLHGGKQRWVRHGGTMLALARLYDHRLLLDTEYGRLASAYRFLRNVEHRLQCADDRQVHTLPLSEQGLELLARQMPDGETREWLLAGIQNHFEHVREIYERVIHTRVASDEGGEGELRPRPAIRNLEQLAPQVAAALAHATLKRGYRAFEHFIERLPATGLQHLNSEPALLLNILDLFEHSTYFAEELIRVPEWMVEVAPGMELVAADPPQTASELRRWYRRMMVRVQSASICFAEPVFETLSRTSGLVDQVIAKVYEIALAEVAQSHPPSRAGYKPKGQMWAVALGRLGMQEFDLASDADLVFVLADTDADEIVFWTNVAQRMVNIIMAYTGDGMLFAVDTRLRPNGNAGALVATETVFKDYFAREAEPWEWITYMKARIVAGDARRGYNFLQQLQVIDWQRYGHSGRSRVDLREMRMRIEKEQGAAHPLKSGRGGYYDIDFMLMYLRLKDAGVYFKVLNTPERIEVLENMGKMDKGLAKTLRESAAFYRALDHGIRVMTGHASDKLPQSPAQVEMLKALVSRWTAIPIEAADEIRTQTRAAFERMFG